jgi:prepilin-type N-terminal cleavage/methylation domain-containing protein
MRIASKNRKRRRESGFSLLEMLIASAVLLIGITGVTALFAVALSRTSTYGDQATRTAEYAQDEMEALLGSSFTSLTAGDGMTTLTSGFYDYILPDGTKTTDSTGAIYMRRWKIADTTSSLKTITVKVTCLSNPLAPSAVLVSQRAVYF